MTWTPDPDSEGRLFYSYKIVIRRTSDGLERTVAEHGWNSSSLFWWSRGEGNGGCDCNRHLAFEQAHDPNYDGDHDCGDNAYEIVRFEFPDGTMLDGAVANQ